MLVTVIRVHPRRKAQQKSFLSEWVGVWTKILVYHADRCHQPPLSVCQSNQRSRQFSWEMSPKLAIYWTRRPYTETEESVSVPEAKYKLWMDGNKITHWRLVLNKAKLWVIKPKSIIQLQVACFCGFGQSI